MLSANDLRKVAARSGARDIGNVEIDVILTYLLQLFTDKGITEHVAFKGGTMLRKMIFGPRGPVRYFLAVASEQNFTRAAEKRYVTQPALSRGIEMLEEEFSGALQQPVPSLQHGDP